MTSGFMERIQLMGKAKQNKKVLPNKTTNKNRRGSKQTNTNFIIIIFLDFTKISLEGLHWIPEKSV